MTQITEKELGKLVKTIPFKWRVQSTYPKSKPTKARMIAYIDARDVAEHLDTIVGPSNWCDSYYSLDGKIYCKIGIKVNGEWVFKSDMGTPNKTEKEKSEASDAFKRAAVKWGINRDAYRIGLVEINVKEYKGKPYPVGDDGKFLKDKLNEYCNNLIKIEELDNYSLEYDEEERQPNSLFTEEQQNG